MTADKKPLRPALAYEDERFMNSPDARPLRILAEYLEPLERFEDLRVSDTIVVMGSARVLPRDVAETRLQAARDANDGVPRAEAALRLSRYYEDARVLSRRLTEWSKGLEQGRRRFVICTGGGPGIMEAANRGASEARGINVGLNIAIPVEQHENPYITRELAFEFHYFFMRKFWFVYLAKAIVLFPGGFGTLDELFEILTLDQTQKLKKQIPVVLYGSEYWDKVIDFQALADFGTIDEKDLKLFRKVDSVDAAFDVITRELEEKSLQQPGGIL